MSGLAGILFWFYWLFRIFDLAELGKLTFREYWLNFIGVVLILIVLDSLPYIVKAFFKFILVYLR